MADLYGLALDAHPKIPFAYSIDTGNFRARETVEACGFTREDLLGADLVCAALLRRDTTATNDAAADPPRGAFARLNVAHKHAALVFPVALDTDIGFPSRLMAHKEVHTGGAENALAAHAASARNTAASARASARAHRCLRSYALGAV